VIDEQRNELLAILLRMATAHVQLGRRDEAIATASRRLVAKPARHERCGRSRHEVRREGLWSSMTTPMIVSADALAVGARPEKVTDLSGPGSRLSNSGGRTMISLTAVSTAREVPGRAQRDSRSRQRSW